MEIQRTTFFGHLSESFFPFSVAIVMGMSSGLAEGQGLWTPCVKVGQNLGYDRFGRVILSYKLDGAITTEIGFPLSVFYRSGEILKAPLIANGWITPMFESCAFKTEENKYVVIFPDGTVSNFYWVNPTLGEMESGSLKGFVQGKNFTVKLPDGGYFSFVNGYLDHLETASQKKYKWNYEKNGNISVNSEAGLTLCSFERTGNEFLFKQGNHSIAVTTESLASDLYRGNDISYVKAIKIDDSEYSDFENKVDGKLYSCKVTGNYPVFFQLDAMSGLLKKINNTDFSVKWHENKFEFPQIISKENNQEKYIFPGIRYTGGVEVLDRGDGSIIENHYFQHPKLGPLLRKTLVLSNLSRTQTYSARYDIEGNLLSDERGEFRRVKENNFYNVYKGDELIRKY